jgi:hypothetical protein
MKPFFRQIAIVATSLILIAQTCALTSCGSKTEAKSADVAAYFADINAAMMRRDVCAWTFFLTAIPRTKQRCKGF